MQPADIIRADRLAVLVCHDEQLDVWAGELLEDLVDHLSPPVDYETVLDLRRTCRCAIRRIVESAFGHPEILGIERPR